MIAPQRLGPAAALAAFVTWGLSGLFYHWFQGLDPAEILSHRVVWSLLLTAALVAARRGGGELRTVLADRRQMAALTLSAAMIAVNWGLFIWAVGNGRALDSSMGYYIYPLVSVLLGVVVLGERLNRRQGAAVALAGLGVAVLAVYLGTVPWIALTLAGTFGIYGLVRKTVRAGPLAGLLVETALVAPLAVWWLVRAGGGVLSHGDAAMTVMLLLTGPMTALPLLLFAYGARRLPLSALGVMQYINPTCQMLVAVLAFGEAFTPAHGAAFACIWAALLLYSVDFSATFRRVRGSLE